MGCWHHRRWPRRWSLRGTWPCKVGIRANGTPLGCKPQALTAQTFPAGRLVDVLKNYELIFYLAGSEVALAGIFMAVATKCCLRRHPSGSQDAPSGPGSEGEASDTEEAEAEVDVDSEPPMVSPEPPCSLETLEEASAGTGEPKAEAEGGPESGSV